MHSYREWLLRMSRMRDLSFFIWAPSSSTPENFCIIYAIPADTTEEQTFTPAVRGGAATAFLLNRTQASTGADGNENTVSSGIIMEIRQL